MYNAMRFSQVATSMAIVSKHSVPGPHVVTVERLYAYAAAKESVFNCRLIRPHSSTVLDLQ